MLHISKVFVIVGSTRATRIGKQVGMWVAEIGRTQGDAEFEVIDLRDWPLPMEGETGIPAMGNYTSEDSQAWSEKILQAGAFVFVTPQYNWGYPASLKNALDHLYREWNGKPAMIVTYGGHGGRLCGAQLRQVLEGGLEMKVLPTMPEITLTRTRIEADTGEISPAQELAEYEPVVSNALADLTRELSTKQSSIKLEAP